MMLPGFENEERSVALDQWYTPPDVARRMAELVDLKGKRVLEPSAGSGNLVRAALDAGGEHVFAIDLDNRNANDIRKRFETEHRANRVGAACSDFLECGIWQSFDVALMNPPWNDGAHWRHIAHALMFAPIVVALAPLAMLEGRERYEKFWCGVTLDQLCICSSRPAFGPEGGKMPVACFVIERGHGDDPTHETIVRFWP